MRFTRLVLPDSIKRVIKDPAIPQVLVVGGAVRDSLLDMPPKDLHFECYGIGFPDLTRVLARHGKVEDAGGDYGACLVTIGGVQYEFGIPRRNAKPRSTPDDSSFDPGLSPEAASNRRDFTINALAVDPRNHTLLDFHNGAQDLRNRVLRHVSPKHFAEDPVRPLRAFQFAARLDFAVAPETVAFSRAMRHSFASVPSVLVRDEWLKWAAKSAKPSRGLGFLRESGYIDHFPSLKKLIGTPQQPAWHPEGDVWTHTNLACDALAENPDWERLAVGDRAVLMLAMVSHDIAKPQCTHTKDVGLPTQRITSYGHERKGGPAAALFLEKELGLGDRTLRHRIEKLVSHHKGFTRGHDHARVKAVATRLQPESLSNLELIVRADYAARPPLPADIPENARLFFECAARLGLKNSKPSPFLLGRHLIDAGMVPGPQFGVVLEYAYQLQLRGDLRSVADAKHWLLLNRTGLEQAASRAGALENAATQEREVPRGN